MLRLHYIYIALINMSTTEKDADRMVLGVDMDEGDNEGIYTTDETEIRSIAKRYKKSISRREFQEMMDVLREEAPRVQRCDEANLIAVNNGIFDYDTKQLMPFSPDKIFT